MNPWWLVVIVPASASFGVALMAMMTTAKKADDEMDRILRGEAREDNNG